MEKSRRLALLVTPIILLFMTNSTILSVLASAGHHPFTTEKGRWRCRTLFPHRLLLASRRWELLTVGVLLSLLTPRLAWSQAGYYLYPVASVAEYYDDNIFRSTSGRADDFVSRFGAGAETGYVSDPLQLLGHYAFASEVYAKNPRLTRAIMLQDAGLRFRYLPTRFWTLGFTGNYTETERPETLNETTGILGSRTRSRNYYLSPSLVHRWDEFTTLTMLYTFNNNRQLGGARTDTHNVRFTIDRQVTWRDILHFAYVFRHYSFTNNRLELFDLNRSGSIPAHVALVGWTRQLSPLMWLTLSGGPRVSQSRVTPEVLATLSRELQYGRMSLTYERTQNSVVGRGGPVTTDRATLSWERQLLNRLLLTVTPGFYNNQSSNLDTQVYRLDMEAVHQFTQWLAVRALYQFRYEQGSIIGARVTSQSDRFRNIVFLEMIFTSPLRLY